MLQVVQLDISEIIIQDIVLKSVLTLPMLMILTAIAFITVVQGIL